MIDKVVEIAQKASIGVMKIYQENSFNIRNKQHNGKLYKHLRHQGKAYRKRYGYPNNRGAIPNELILINDLGRLITAWYLAIGRLIRLLVKIAKVLSSPWTSESPNCVWLIQLIVDI